MEAVPHARSHGYGDVYVSAGARAHLGDVIYADHSAKSPKQTLLNALRYPNMHAKRAKLAMIQATNLEWIWDSSDPTRFQDWLTTRNDIFWICGKPASGKSTLTKFLAEHDNISDRLTESTGMDWMVIYFNFDFRAGKSIANSLEGLLRALLHQMCRQNGRIAQYIAEDPIGEDLVHPGHSVSMDDLLKLVERITKDVKASMCVFVDGLDEFEERATRACKMQPWSDDCKAW